MKTFINRLQCCLILAGMIGVGTSIHGQVVLPIEFRAVEDGQTWINYRAVGGMPISKTPGEPPGSNGLLPDGNESSDTDTPPTPGQFRGFMSFGAVPGHPQARWQQVANSTTLNQGTTAFSGEVAQNMQLPMASAGGQILMILRRAQVGAPFVSRRSAFSFGSVVPPPDTDEEGTLLEGIPPTAYWLPEPYTVNNHQGTGYYWSPHARQIYAIQPGPISITWRKATPYPANNLPAYTNPGGGPSFQINGANAFKLFTQSYIVSGSASKPPRRMHWTQKGFQNIGMPVVVPAARVGAVNIVYNNNFPKTVLQEFQGIGSTNPTDGSDNESLQELRTLWYEEQLGQLYAYNAEGRVFVELLGDRRADGQTHVPLGVEIVDVTRQAIAVDVVTELGERIVPPDGLSVSELFPRPMNQGVGNGFAFTHTIEGVARDRLYAVRETFNLNDYLVHWLEEGVAGLRWPRALGRYHMRWPDDLSKYSHYMRPPAASAAEAAITSIYIEPENAPVIEYQDLFDQPRARFTPELKFYTWLDETYPVHRTLLRYVSGENIGFERVLSTLNTALLGPVVSNDDLVDQAVGLPMPGREAAISFNAEARQFGQFQFSPPFGGENFAFEVVVQGAGNMPRGPILTFQSEDQEQWIRFGVDDLGRMYIRHRSLLDTGPGNPTPVMDSIVAPNPLPVHEWLHLAVSVSSSTVTLYVNGQSVHSALSINIPHEIFPTTYVGRSDEGVPFATMDLAMLRLWSTSRSASDIQSAASSVLDPGTPGLLAQFHMNRLQNPVFDSSGNGFHMHLMGDTTPGLGGLALTTAPRYVSQTVQVGDRLGPPPGELGGEPGDEYLAGYIRPDVGSSYHPGAYINPLDAGLENANMGAIIPVNAIPGDNELEVWWFRRNNSSAGLNAGNNDLGFRTVLWPSIIGRYTIQWPTQSREIVLASRLGGQGLSTSEAAGTIYFENDRSKIGYNPNEEHAIMQGGTPFATRDDLNNITPGPDYSSHPFVLVQYTHPDGRPDVSVFKVLREKPEAGFVFDYVVPAGQLLQPPPPLNFLQKPLLGSGDSRINFNTEPPSESGDLPGGWSEDAESGLYGHYIGFTYRDRKDDFWVYRGPHAGLPELEAGTYDVETDSFGPMPDAVAVEGQLFVTTLHVSRQTEFLSMAVSGAPDWLESSGFSLIGTPPAGSAGAHALEVVVFDLYDQTRVTNSFHLSVINAGVAVGQLPLALPSTNQYTGSIITFTNRAPFLARSPAPDNSFTLQYYYKTEPSFAWPDMTTPPPPGSIVPYLRRIDELGEYVGEPDGTDNSLEIVYRPFWPVRDPRDSSQAVPTLPYGGTLARPAFNLPGVRDFKTAHILYEQSIARDLPEELRSAVLHDPTRAKTAPIDLEFEDRLPPSIQTQLYQGKVYFPNLPPHLVDRVFVDPNIGAKGALVLIGEYKQELLGESYLMLNVLRGSDLESVKELCPEGDEENRPKWEALVDALATRVETFMENPDVPGQFIPDPFRSFEIGVEDLAEVWNDNIAVDSYAISATGPGSGYITVLESSGNAFTDPGDPVQMHIFKIGGDLHRGELKIIPSPNPLSELITFQHTADLAGRFDEYEYEWKIAAPVNGMPPPQDASMSQYLSLTDIAADIPRYTLGGAGIQALGDNYLVMRYRPLDPEHPLYVQNPTNSDWSEWTRPALAEGWIKRVLAGINPFNQRVNDLFNNQVNTDVSIIAQAGPRWEGDVALNMDTINDYGLIEIYETVLRRGRSLSIESGFNYGPANDALLLAAGYLNDLYMMLGNEAWADAANPTIGIGTADNTFGDIATALFSFRGQVPTLLEEELALLRGRDDVLQPGVEITPVYNRLIWNYTRGIDAGEVIYALNYNIQENPLQADGVVNAEDAARMFPQGHGDAYGHFLTALKGYYSLLMNSNFDWVPRIEAVNVLGQPVSVDYLDERKFAAAATAVGRAGRQVFDLTWRRDYQGVSAVGWEHMSPTRENTQRSHLVDGEPTHPVRHWGMDHWASRTGQGLYLHWVVGNAMLPHEDPIPTNEGIQKIDRTTVPELRELARQADGLQKALENAERGLSPLGIPEDGLVFDLNPNTVVGPQAGSHFDQVYDRALQALRNAVTSFNDAKGVTQLMRREENSLTSLREQIERQERSYEVELVDLYGTPYPDDIGPGRLYRQGYSGPDLLHYMYVDLPEVIFPDVWSYNQTDNSWTIDLWDLPEDWVSNHYTAVNFETVQTLEFNIGPHGYAEKPADWQSRRLKPGRIQQAISELILSHARLRQEINDLDGDHVELQKKINLFEADVVTYNTIRGNNTGLLVADEIVEKAKFADDLFQKYQDSIKQDIVFTSNASSEAIPGSFIAGVASGGDLTSAARSAVEMMGYGVVSTLDKVSLARYTVVNALELATSTARRQLEFWSNTPLERQKELRASVYELGEKLGELQVRLWTINRLLREYDDKQRALRRLIADGDTLQLERQIFRQRSAAVVQGYRTRDAAFRIFRNEKLERYKTLFDLAARYSLLAANAYDYETGLLHTDAGRAFIGRILASRALGVVSEGLPQFAGSDTGDPGLSSVLAEMRADWEVLRGRLGINNPDAYGTTVSLRSEHFRLLPGIEGDTHWRDRLNMGRMLNVLDDADVRRYCMQIAPTDGMPVPGIVLTFSTTIAPGLNLFGLPLAAGDHAYSASSFATKLFGVGVALEGYQGMAQPSSNSGAVSGGGGSSASEPGSWFLNDSALAATPYVYLIPVGLDSMRSPPLGDVSTVRTWRVEDLAIPLPFNIGASGFSDHASPFQAADFLTEPMFGIRKHQAFRPVDNVSHFAGNIYTTSGSLLRSQYTNNRLIGRSVWNSHWKLVIPGNTLLSNPDEGLERFIRTVKDIRLHFVTYSYAGN